MSQIHSDDYWRAWLCNIIHAAVCRVSGPPHMKLSTIMDVCSPYGAYGISWEHERRLQPAWEWVPVEKQRQLVMDSIVRLIKSCKIRHVLPHPKRRRHVGWETAFEATTVLDEIVRAL